MSAAAKKRRKRLLNRRFRVLAVRATTVLIGLALALTVGSQLFA